MMCYVFSAQFKQSRVRESKGHVFHLTAAASTAGSSSFSASCAFLGASPVLTLSLLGLDSWAGAFGAPSAVRSASGKGSERWEAACALARAALAAFTFSSSFPAAARKASELGTASFGCCSWLPAAGRTSLGLRKKHVKLRLKQKTQ